MPFKQYDTCISIQDNESTEQIELTTQFRTDISHQMNAVAKGSCLTNIKEKK